jgi:ornithine cyclodeaminase/alanine dehydrogenase-like protein (mu-crystallin family)
LTRRPYQDISDAQVRASLTDELAIQTVEATLLMHAEGRAGVSSPVIQHVKTGPDGQAFRLKGGWVGPGGPSISGIRVDAYTGQLGVAPPVRPQRWIILNDLENLQTIARVDSEYINKVRVGAFGGVAARVLARPGSRTVGLLGSGILATTIARCLAITLNRPDIFVYSRTHENAVSFAAELSASTGCRIEAVRSSQEACEGRDLIISITTANEPIVKRSWLKPGATFLNMGGRTEAEEACLLDVDRVVIDEWTFCTVQGDIAPRAKEGRFTREMVYAEVADLLAGKQAVRHHPDEVVVAPMQGMATLDLACAYAVYDALIHR